MEQPIQLLELSLEQLTFQFSAEQTIKDWNNFDFIKCVCIYGCKNLSVNKTFIIEMYGFEIGNLLYKYNIHAIYLYDFFYHMINPEYDINTLDPKGFYDSVLRKLGKLISYKYQLVTACQNMQITIPVIEQNPGDLKDKISTTSLIPLNQKGCVIAAEYADNMRINERYSQSTLDLNLHLEWDSGSELGPDEDPDSYRIDSNRPRKKK